MPPCPYAVVAPAAKSDPEKRKPAHQNGPAPHGQTMRDAPITIDDAHGLRLPRWDENATSGELPAQVGKRAPLQPRNLHLRNAQILCDIALAALLQKPLLDDIAARPLEHG